MPPTIAISHPTTIIFHFFFMKMYFIILLIFSGIFQFSNIFLHMSINVCTYVCMYIYIYMSRMDTERIASITHLYSHRITKKNEDPKITTYVLQQNIYNQTQKQHSHANIYTVQHKTNIFLKN